MMTISHYQALSRLVLLLQLCDNDWFAAKFIQGLRKPHEYFSHAGLEYMNIFNGNKR